MKEQNESPNGWLCICLETVVVYMLRDSGGDQWREDYTSQVQKLGPYV